MGLTIFLISITKQIYGETLNFSDKQRLLHENEVVKFLQNYKCQTLIKAILESPDKVLQLK